jgi:hypothetical protein
VGDDTLDRLTVYGELARAPGPEQRRRLFLALDPVWRSINGHNLPTSPYRRLIALDATRGDELPAAREASLAGVPPDSLEPWLLAILAAWRAAAPDSVIEPWDWYYLAGRPTRKLGSRVPRERLVALNAAVYRAVGADLGALNVRYDLEPREGKTPVAFCTFGARPRWTDGRWTPGEPSVFATYRTGGLDNLAELLHETGHAIHLAAIRTRPAFSDWPDSDPFTEAVADFIALDVAEPALAVALVGRLGPAGRRPSRPLRRDRPRRRVVAVRAPDAARAVGRSQRGLDPAHIRVPARPAAPRALLVGDARPAGGLAGVHDELRGRRDADRRLARADRGATRALDPG